MSRDSCDSQVTPQQQSEKKRTVTRPHRPLSYSKKRAAWLLFVYYYIVKTESLRDLRFWALWAPTEGIGDGLRRPQASRFFWGKKHPQWGAARGAFGSRVPVLMDQVQR
jgi:hypothetical protein